MSKIALITGGSGALGSAIVRAFHQDGYEVVFTYKSNEKNAKVLVEETGALALQADLTNRDQVRETVRQTLDRHKQIDILVNNAGFTQVMPFALLEEEDWDEVMAANLKTMFLVTREVVRGMIGRKSGAIVNVGSLAGNRMLEVPVHYATAKAGVNGFTLSLAKELSRYHIRVNSVVPGLLDGGVGRMVPEKELSDYIAHCAAGRPGKTAEIAETVLFLASDKAQYINAQNIFVDGGI